MAKQDEQDSAPSDSMTPQQRPQRATPAQPTRDPYAMGPTNYESFSRAYDSNAATAQQGAKDLSNKVSGEAQQAQSALQQAYGGATGQMDQNAQNGVQSAAWSTPEAVREQVSKASADASALGGTTGQVQALMGPRATGFGASLVRQAGGQNFKNEAAQYAGLRAQVGQADANAQQAQKDANAQAQAVADENAERALNIQTQNNAQLGQEYAQYLKDASADASTYGGGGIFGTGSSGVTPESYQEWLTEHEGADTSSQAPQIHLNDDQKGY